MGVREGTPQYILTGLLRVQSSLPILASPTAFLRTLGQALISEVLEGREEVGLECPLGTR